MLYGIKTKYVWIFSVITIVIIFSWLRDDYKDKHDECRIYRNNLESQILDFKVTSINKEDQSIFVQYLNDSTKYLLLDKSFIDSVHVGDIIHKSRGSNQVAILRYRGKMKLQFAQIPNKHCKL